MKKLNLTELQRHKVQEALRNAGDVLRDIKQRPLEGNAQEQMRLLEGAVAAMEMFSLGVGR